MKDVFKTSFLNDIKRIKDKTVLDKIYQAVACVEKATTLQTISGLKKIKGTKKGIYYRIKMDDYRIGITIEDETVTFVVFAHRKDIYKNFP
ncbi:MAG: type II toxin-antitoxin system RelE/ParE family toxin [Tannerella sp.]|jgi:mRNA interferase RelE/StbE|nr:type II toxin-antitoxin system RelE/ParE family toxin [Tannerella sp.]